MASIMPPSTGGGAGAGSSAGGMTSFQKIASGVSKFLGKPGEDKKKSVEEKLAKRRAAPIKIQRKKPRKKKTNTLATVAGHISKFLE